MASDGEHVAGLTLIVVGAAILGANWLHARLLKSGFRASQAFKTVSPSERAVAEERAGAAQHRFVRAGESLGVLLVICGVVLLIV